MEKKILSLMLIVVMLSSLTPVTCFAQSQEVTWTETTFDYMKKTDVTVNNVTYFDRTCYLSKTDWWKAFRIEKGTTIGYIYTTVSAGRATTSTPNTKYDSVNYGTTWPQSYDIYITMEPKSYIQCKYYCGYSYNMNNAKVDASLVTKKFYIASDCLTNYCFLPKDSSGFISNWSPKDENSISGNDSFSTTVGINMTTGGVGAGVTIGKTIEYSNSFVDITDSTSVAMGKYFTKYDYKITDSVGYCSPARRKVIFADTTVHDSVSWYNRSRGMVGRVYAVGTFTVCDNKTNPTCYNSFIGYAVSNTLTIK